MSQQKPENPEEKSKPAKSTEGHKLLMATTVCGLVLASVGFMKLADMKVLEPPVHSDRVAGLSSIDAGLALSDASGMIVPLTYNDGKIDVLYAGAPECSHCQAFMDDGFDDLVAFASENKLDLAYMPMALSGLGVSIASVEECALPTAKIPAPDVVKMAYASVDKIRAAAREANQAIKDGQSAQEADDILMSAVKDFHNKISNPAAYDDDCYHEAADSAGAKMMEFSDNFGLTGTPSFYFVAPDGSVTRSVGRPDYATMTAALTQKD